MRDAIKRLRLFAHRHLFIHGYPHSVDGRPKWKFPVWRIEEAGGR